MVSEPDRLGDRDGDTRGGGLEVAAVVDRPALDRDRPGQRRSPGVAPVGPALGRMPGLPAIDRDLDARDDTAAGVGGRAGDRDRGPARQGRAGRRRGDDRGWGRMVGRRGGRHEPGLERGRLDPHVGEQVDRRLLHVGVGIGKASCRHGPSPGPRTTAPCRRRRPGRRCWPGRGSGCGSPCLARRC